MLAILNTAVLIIFMIHVMTCARAEVFVGKVCRGARISDENSRGTWTLFCLASMFRCNVGDRMGR